MRIAFALTQSLESPSCLGRYLPMARRLAALGHDIHLVALHHDLASAGRSVTTDQGVTIHIVGQMHMRKVGDESRYFALPVLLWVVLIGTLGILRTLLRLRPEIIHLGKPHPQNSAAGWLAARLTGGTLLLDYDDLEAESNHATGVQAALLARLERTVPRLCRGVTVHSNFLLQQLLEYGVPSAHILQVPSSVDVPTFAYPDPERVAQWRAQLKSGAAPVVLYVGTLSLANHPVDLLLRAFALVLPRLPNAVLLLAGGGKDFGALKQLAAELGIAEATRFLGRVPPADIPALFALASCSVDPVHDDDVARARWPIKLIESLAAGVPVVTGNVGDRQDILGASAGLLTPPGDPAALAKAITSILSDAELQARLRAGCHARAQLYTPERVIEPLAAWYAKQRAAHRKTAP